VNRHPTLTVDTEPAYARDESLPPSRALSILLAAVALVACGGGGDSPPAPPQRAAPPPAAALLPAAPFGLTSSQSFAVLGWARVPGASAWSEVTADTATFNWSATLGTYQLELKDVGSGSLMYTFPGKNDAAYTMRYEDGSTAPLAITVRSRTQTAGWLWWSPLDGASLSTGNAAFGIATVASDIPASGTRIFVGNDSSQVAPTLEFDFDAGRLTGKVSIAWVDAWGPYPATTYDLSPASFDRTATTFSATFTVPGAPAQGSIHGMFMGRGAREVAVAWQSPIVDPYSSQWTTVREVWLGYCTNCGN
jgi:hypothetical protein